jgi:CRP-like cAMP-binding protein
MDKLRTFFEQTIPINDEVWDFFASHLIRLELPSKTTILKQGQVEKYISFIEQGATRGFIPKEDNDVTFAFVFENELLCAYDSFLTQTPCLYQIETLANTILWRFSYDILQKLYREMPITNILGRVATEQIYLNKAKRELSFLNDTAEERYLKLFTDRPNLFTEIPLKYVASYIGVTPQALSRIRKRIS